jgi:glucosamine-6-phosphate deaminase
MKWQFVEDYEELSDSAALLLLDALDRNPQIVLGLPTGGTPLGMYRHLVDKCRSSSHCFEGATTFNLDEYVGIDSSHPGSYCAYMRQNLFSHVDLRPERIHVPDGTGRRILSRHSGLSLEEALELECSDYEDRIIRAGCLQLTVLGLGQNGHIAFNEPGTGFDARTRVVELSASTRLANARYFPDEEVPSQAITMGIATILDSAAIVLLASGESKASAIDQLANGAISTDFPASALKRHHDVTVIVDRAAASKL